jgi:hypothetical protein
MKPDLSHNYKAKERNNVTIKARVGRNIDGMDLHLYEKALALRRTNDNKMTL